MPPPSQSQSQSQSQPPSILGQSRFQRHRTTGSAPSSLDHAASLPPPAPALSRMPPSFRARGARLQAFVRGASEGNVAQNHNPAEAVPPQPPPPEQPPNPPRTVAPVPIRPQPAEAVRILPINNGRSTAPPLERTRSAVHQGPFRPPSKSPTRSEQASPTIRPNMDSNDRDDDLFAGSQLGESFMESGLSTPFNEPAEPVTPKPEPVRDLNKNYPGLRNLARDDIGGRTTRNSRDAEFLIGDDRLMSVVHGKLRYNPSHMKDGFQDGAIDSHRKNNEGYQTSRPRPADPFEAQSKLPLREVKIRRSHTGAAKTFTANNDARSPSPAPKKTKWQIKHRAENDRHHVLNLDSDDEVESQPDEEIETTPKAKKVRPVQLRDPLKMAVLPLPVASSQPRNKKRQRGGPDYDDKALSTMTFEELQKQHFDFDPSKALDQRGAGSRGGQLADKLDQCRHLGEMEQHQFFSSMSVDDWEASGEWFSHQFSGLMEGLRKLRQEKRRIIRQFEEEAASREEAVRLRSEAIDRKLLKMKQNGQRVVQDREA